ncbi:MerR family transcriptional regulator [Oceanobacillus jeddahense]|uniref:MerR family transcriptional regulator n=1 Tax=Oceanobacillus jeddahense TaxID=1462527 RepID=A0ABY5JVH8_9BACI|nr:MerR family transcriptional regulator [Oceanobacillus jeddahense]UUI04385.1 MerR family transcriptional regulator [Oceanobacillus jeddahense]
MYKNLYSIGEVAKLNNISIQTLRYYDKIDLFTPASIDPESNYRYYHEKQFFYLDIIKYLKYIDTPLSQIREIMKKDAAQMLPFLEEQGDIIDNKINQLKQAQSMLHHRKLQIKEQNILANRPRGKIYKRFVEEQVQLHLTTTDLTPYGNPDVYMRDLAYVLETKENKVVDNFYGCVYELKDYQDTGQIVYSSIYTSLTGDELLLEKPKSNIFKKHLSEGMYICICFEWSEDQYFHYYQALYDYIRKNKIDTAGLVYEVSLPNRYFSYEEDDFITELRIKLKETS